MDQVDGWVIMKGGLCAMEPRDSIARGFIAHSLSLPPIRSQLKRSPPQAGLAPGTARSAGRGSFVQNDMIDNDRMKPLNRSAALCFSAIYLEEEQLKWLFLCATVDQEVFPKSVYSERKDFAPGILSSFFSEMIPAEEGGKNKMAELSLLKSISIQLNTHKVSTP